jgi:uncharacterized protein
LIVGQEEKTLPKKSNPMKKHTVIDELYVIPHDDNYVLYAPLKGLVFLVNEDLVTLLSLIEGGIEREFSRQEQAIIDDFIAYGIIDGENEVLPKIGTDFHPTGVTIFLTSDCQLRCVYCYACGGREKFYIKWPIAKRAIDLVVENCLKTASKEVHMSFHGGGEPTLHWSLLQQAVDYAQETCAHNNLNLNTHITTNGILSDHQLSYIINRISSVGLSFDGPEDIQNAQRPFAGGQGSFDQVMRTLKFFNKHNYRYRIRTTISQAGLDRINEIVSFIKLITEDRPLHIEPISECGRCESTGWEMPSVKKYVESIKKFLADKRVRIRFSTDSLLQLRSSHCGATGDNFCITPQGFVTSCFEVTLRNDQGSKICFYGHYDEKTNDFIIDFEKLNYLRSRRVENIPLCQECFAKWICAGECLNRSILRKNFFMPDKKRCIINREVLKSRLIQIIKEREK